jgi:hypothetical protein
MSIRRFLMLGLLGALATLAAVAWLSRAASAQELVLTVSVPRVPVGEEQGVSIEVGGLGERGLGAWTLDLTYDPELLEPTSCNVGGLMVCNLDYAENTIRIAGASIETFPPEGNFSIASGIFFDCLEPGDAELKLIPRIFVDQTLGDPQPIDVPEQRASFVCAEAAEPEPTGLPFVGAGTGSPDADELLRWLVAGFAGTGVAAMIAFALLRTRARRP